jgi:hypothetical protein
VCICTSGSDRKKILQPEQLDKKTAMEKPSLSQTKTIMNKSESSIENLYLFSKISVVFICK